MAIVAWKCAFHGRGLSSKFVTEIRGDLHHWQRVWGNIAQSKAGAHQAHPCRSSASEISPLLGQRQSLS